jgi:uncharacterized protein
MTGLTNSYCSPKLEVREVPAKGGFGLFAGQSIQAGELVVVWGGRIVPQAELDQLPEDSRRHGIQVEEEMFCVPLEPSEPADYINHSCHPNTGLRGQIALVALRDIAVDEEVAYDYATSDSCPYDEFECVCGAPDCRDWITGNDWKRPELWERYQGYFSPYLLRRIERLLAGQEAAAALPAPAAVFKPVEDAPLQPNHLNQNLP